ncbi:SDR family NAD(P)-dependent oxidoreductase [Thiomicrorhabdus sp.]|uniref:SDR family NAD(P)-dependent oxidoreductase n=1 Tax=Thiomicrorhabdus sp. TaxID=2039724 RepID=UPI0029C84554|nr:SDR family NAD(P)-dependent oxidoreductase [Thiomicrorhabdus sp.]
MIPDQTTSLTALITGASSGIGRAIARKLAKDGYRLLLLARREEKLSILQTELQNLCEVDILVVDINDHEHLHRELQRHLQQTPIDILINNAGLALGLEPADQTDWQDWRNMIETNCLSLAYITRQILPSMIEHNRGHIINMGSIAGSYAYKGANVYGASKAFVEQFSANLRSDLLGSAIRVTNIEPGLLGDSEFSQVRFKGDRQRAKSVYENLQPLKSEDIAESVAWVLQQPAHVNINRIEIMPVHQALGGPVVTRNGHQQN